MYGIRIDAESSRNKYQQLVEQLREAILRGQLESGLRMASTRDLAGALGISRGVVVEAVEQLTMEGFLEGRSGSGTYVRAAVSWPLPIRAEEPGTRDSEVRPSDASLSFLPGVADPQLFPRRAWLACYQRAVEYATEEDLGYTRPSGRSDLREAVADHLARSKGMQISPEQVIITAGSAQAIALVLQLHRGSTVVVEDPGAPFITRLVLEGGAQVAEVPADEEGLVTDKLPQGHWSLALVTPGHQFPLGGTLPADRRAALLAAAESRDAWILEDDFDTDLRYRYRSVPPLQVTAPDRVIHVGSFSKTLTPALRLGYLVAPKELVPTLRARKSRWDLWNEGFQQKAMAIFLREGHLDRHLRRSLTVYRSRNQWFREAVAQHLVEKWSVVGDTTGTHLVLVTSEPSVSARAVARNLATQGLQVEPVSAYSRSRSGRDNSLIIGFGHRTENELIRLIQAIREATSQ